MPVRSEILEKYKNGYIRLIDILYNIQSEAYDYKPAPGKWSIREVIIHVVDSEVNGFIRLRKAIAESGSSIAPYEQDRWAEFLHYEAQSIDENLELFKILRSLTYKLLLQIKEEEWDNYFMHPERGKTMLENYLRLLNDHVDVHIKQILRNYDSWNAEPKDNTI